MPTPARRYDCPSDTSTPSRTSPHVSIGILTADLSELGSEVTTLERAGANLVHFDVMDGCFCPMMTFGAPVIKAVKTSLLKDVHLLTADLIGKLQDFVAAGADIMTIHVESCSHPHRALQMLGSLTNANDPERGLVRGLALNPGTPLEAAEPLLGEVDLILLLAVNPGWSGVVTHFGFVAPGFSTAQPSKCRPEESA